MPTTTLRAAIIIGSGSASFKILHALVNKSPLFLIPFWAKTKCQPIAIRDVMKYMVGCLETPETAGKVYDIGGAATFTYLEMLRTHARVLGKKRYFIPSFFSSIRVYSRIASMLAPVPRPITRSLMRSCLNDVICQHDDIVRQIPFRRLPFQEALQRALERQRFAQHESAHSGEGRTARSKKSLRPPSPSHNVLTDIANFLIHQPERPTLVKFQSEAERQSYSFRIMQRLGIDPTKFAILNVHQIGVNAPAKYVFEELLKWDFDSTCWPNNLAQVGRIQGHLENIQLFLFGIKKYPFGLKKSFLGIKYIPLFNLDALRFQLSPQPTDLDNPRFLLYKSSGGYPIGIFCMYVRSPISTELENEPAQLFFLTSFNFYGQNDWTLSKIINKPWEWVHDRVTSNILNRIKQLCEWRFDKIQSG